MSKKEKNQSIKQIKKEHEKYLEKTQDNNGSGWIKINRSVVHHWIFPDLMSHWTYLLLKANWTDKKWFSGSQVIVIKRGSFVTSISKLGLAWKCSRNKVRRILKNFEDDDMIGLFKDSRYLVVTIRNYDKYQHSEDVQGQTLDIRRTAEGQQKDTTKNYKEYKRRQETVPLPDDCPQRKLRLQSEKYLPFGSEDAKFRVWMTASMRESLDSEFGFPCIDYTIEEIQDWAESNEKKWLCKVAIMRFIKNWIKRASFDSQGRKLHFDPINLSGPGWYSEAQIRNGSLEQ